MTSGLNERQTRFVRAYRETGNATESARRAGYAGSADTLAQNGSKLLRNPKVAAELAKHAAKAEKKHIADVEELHAFWTSMLRDDAHEPKDRLKASELQAKALGAFVEKREVTGKDGGPQEHAVTVNITREQALSLARKKGTPL